MSDTNLSEEENETLGTVGKWLFIGTIVVMLLIAIFNSLYTIGETESAIVTTFGKATVVEEKGLHTKVPFFQKVTKVDTTNKGLTIGYEHIDGDNNDIDIDSESMMITSDFNIVDLDYYVTYYVSDPYKYVYNSNSPELILKNIAMSCIRDTISAYGVDAVLTTGKSEIQTNIETLIRERLETEDIGITLVNATMQDSEAPTDSVKAAFTDVENARQYMDTAVNEGNKYRNEQIPAAEAKADKIIQDAEATKTARINEANGQVARFNEEYEQYKNYPLITKQRMFYETMSELLPKLKVVIDDGDGEITKFYPIESMTTINSVTSSVTSDN